MKLQCSACRQVKPIQQFNKNKSTKRGYDCYCKHCRAQYYKAGRTWPNQLERKAEKLTRGVWVCSCCKEEKPIADFYINKQHDISYYCKKCIGISNRRKYSLPETKARIKQYVNRPETKARIAAWKKATPRQTLNVSLNRALKRRTTINPITINDLMEMWQQQKSRCALSGIKFTWSNGLAKILPNTISIDRIDATKGYEKGNVRLVCYAINCFRGQMNDAELFKMAKTLVRSMHKHAKSINGEVELPTTPTPPDPEFL